MTEEEAYERFFDSYYDPVRRAVTLATGDAGTAEDATAEAFARAYRRWARVSRMDDPRAWVYVVAMNVARRSYRRRRVVPWGDRDHSHVDVAGQATDTAATTALLAALTDRQRSAVVLRYLADLPYADVGRALGCAESTARATVHQALTRLRAEVTEATDGS